MKGNLVYLYAALRTLAGWKHARFRVTVDGREREVVGYSVAIGNSKAYGGGMFVFPHAKLDDGLLDVLTVAKHGKLRWLARVPKVFKGTHVDNPYGRFETGEVVQVVADRPFTVYADGDPIAELPLEVTIDKAFAARDRADGSLLMLRLKLMLARLARAMSRRLGRGGGTTLPGRLLLRLDKHAIGRLGQRLEAGTALLSATNGKTTTASMIAGILERGGRPVVRNAAGSNMHWGIATALIDAGRDARELGLFEVDEAWLPAVARELQPDTFVLCNLFRDQLDRYGELELLADRWAELVGGARRVGAVRAERRRPAGRRPRPGAAGRRLLRHLRRLAGAARAPARRRLEALPQLRDAVRLRGRLPRPPRPLPLPGLRAGSGPSPTWSPSGSSSTGCRARASRCARRRAATEIRLPLPGLYNVYNAVAAAAAAMELGASLDDVKASLEAQTAAFGRVETIPVEGRDVSILLVKNPAGANEVLRTLTLESRELDLWIALNDKIADGRDVSWVWDADFELLAGRVRRVDLLGHARRGDGAAAEVRRASTRSSRSSATSGARSTPPWRPWTEAAGCSPCRPTPRCSSCATCSPSAGLRGHGRAERRLARRRVRGLHRRPRAVARARGHGARARCSTSAAERAGWRSTWPLAGAT